VIQAALQHRGFECIPIGSEAAGGALRQPAREVGFILNRSEHWFALRRIGAHWSAPLPVRPCPALLRTPP